MKDTIKIISVLTIVCVACAFFLTIVYSKAEPVIKKNAKIKIERALTNLAPLTEKTEKLLIGSDTIYKLLDKNNNLLGYGFSASGQGYQGTIKIMAVIDTGLSKLGGIEIVDSSETPGLGAKIKDASFGGQFKDLTVSSEIECLNTDASAPNQIKAISGATVSSKAVTNILNTRINALKAQMKDISK
jgi:H+/Na+-translocating ferredoxin:NAD+ oxidoreductase subunit G